MSASPEVQQRLDDLRRRHPEAFAKPAQQDAPTVVPSSTRTPTAPTSAPRPLNFDVHIKGEVLQDAHATTERGSCNAVVTVLLQQRLGALPVLAVRRYDSTATSHTVAHSIARRLRAGTRVDVSGKGLCLADHEGRHVLRVLDVQTIEPPPEPTTRKDFE